MKKITTLFIAGLALSLSTLTGCNGNKEKNEPEKGSKGIDITLLYGRWDIREFTEADEEYPHRFDAEDLYYRACIIFNQEGRGRMVMGGDAEKFKWTRVENSSTIRMIFDDEDQDHMTLEISTLTASRMEFKAVEEEGGDDEDGYYVTCVLEKNGSEKDLYRSGITGNWNVKKIEGWEYWDGKENQFDEEWIMEDWGFRKLILNADGSGTWYSDYGYKEEDEDLSESPIKWTLEYGLFFYFYYDEDYPEDDYEMCFYIKEAQNGSMILDYTDWDERYRFHLEKE